MTAVEWLVSKIWKTEPLEHEQEVIEQVKEMEKQKLIEFGEIVANKWCMTDIPLQSIERTYNETYGSKGSDEHHEDNLEEIISKAHTNITRRKGKEYAPTSNEIQAEIEKSEKPINLLSNQEGVFYSHNDVLEMMKKFHTYEMNIELNMLKLTPLNLTSSQKEISDEEILQAGKEHFSQIIGATQNDVSAWISACQWYREQLKSRQ